MGRHDSTEMLIHNVHDHIRTGEPKTVNEIAEDMGMHEKTVYRYIQVLISRGMCRPVSVKNKRITYEGTKPSIIPVVPSPNGPVTMMGYVHSISKIPAEFKSPISQLDERFNFAMITLMHQSVVWSDDVKEDIEQYLRQFRQALEFRLRLINALLSENKFWIEDSVKSFRDDAEFNEKLIRETWTKLNERAVRKQRDEFKSEAQKESQVP